MHRTIRSAVLHLSILACLATANLAVNSPASAQCAGTNTCFGTYALSNNTSGSENSAFGYWSLINNTQGNGNTAVGFFSLFQNTTGSYNTASGRLALGNNTTGSGNTAFGHNSLSANTSGTWNTASGDSALQNSTTGIANTASGYAALLLNTTGSYNTASGMFALWSSATANHNTASGYQALFNQTTGSSNTASGSAALYGATTGWRNVALGYQAGYAVTTGSDNIHIGAANLGLASDQGVIRLGSRAYQRRAFVAGIFGSRTNAISVPVLIDPYGQLGTIKSSRRFKEDIQPMGSISERLFALRPVTFRYRDPYEGGSKPVQFGLVAEEVAEVFPELVVYDEGGKPETVSYHLLAALLLNELQKEHQIAGTLQQQINALTRQNEVHAADLAALKEQVTVLAKAAGRAEKGRMVVSAR